MGTKRRGRSRDGLDSGVVGQVGENDGADEGVERVEDFETVGLDEDFVGILGDERRNGETNIGFEDGGGEGQERTREEEEKKKSTK